MELIDNNRISLIPKYLACVDGMTDGAITGRLFCGIVPNGKPFIGIENLLLIIDEIMDKIDYPQSTVDKRVFANNKKQITDAKTNKEAVLAMRKYNIEEKKGDIATFVIQVQFRQNASWQGTVKWVEKEQTIVFRSALELIKIIDSAQAEGYQVKTENERAFI